MRVSLHKHEHIEAPVREGGPLGSESADVFAQGIRILLSILLNLENDDSRLAAKKSEFH
jgi:hypothetical protein